MITQWLYADLHTQSRRDELMRLDNRWAMQEQLLAVTSVERGANPGFSILLVDVDHFKVVNDRSGTLQAT